MKKLSQKDIAIFGQTHDEVRDIIALLKEFGVDYKENKKDGREFKAGETILIDEEYTCTINIDIARVLAKIAFNYFAYCAMQGNRNILYSSNFDKIRKFIYEGISDQIKEVISSINEEPILKEEIDSGKRLVAHIINFLPDDGNIVVRMTFFGLPAIYKIILGPLPPELNFPNFGCGHAFNPFAHELHNLSQTRTDNLTEEQIRLSFGLFLRMRV